MKVAGFFVGFLSGYAAASLLLLAWSMIHAEEQS